MSRQDKRTSEFTEEPHEAEDVFITGLEYMYLFIVYFLLWDAGADVVFGIRCAAS